MGFLNNFFTKKSISFTLRDGRVIYLPTHRNLLFRGSSGSGTTFIAKHMIDRQKLNASVYSSNPFYVEYGEHLTKYSPIDPHKPIDWFSVREMIYEDIAFNKEWLVFDDAATFFTDASMPVLKPAMQALKSKNIKLILVEAGATRNSINPFLESFTKNIINL